jgi:hypothetical protein
LNLFSAAARTTTPKSLYLAVSGEKIISVACKVSSVTFTEKKRPCQTYIDITLAQPATV